MQAARRGERHRPEGTRGGRAGPGRLRNHRGGGGRPKGAKSRRVGRGRGEGNAGRAAPGWGDDDRGAQDERARGRRRRGRAAGARASRSRALAFSCAEAAAAAGICCRAGLLAEAGAEPRGRRERRDASFRRLRSNSHTLTPPRAGGEESGRYRFRD